MKKLGSLLIPVGMFLVLTLMGNRIIASGKMDMSTIGILAIAFVVVLLFTKSKNGSAKTPEAVIAELLDEYAAGAFDENEALKNKFYAAMTDYGKNMPKAALAKLEKLEPLCTTDKEKYAVALVSAKTNFLLQKYPRATREYRRAMLFHPTAEMACTVGDCYQRIGDLDNARDSYHYAIDLDSNYADAYSRLATTYVADWDYETALDYAEKALELKEDMANALATAAICHGMMDNSLLRRSYTEKAVANGYSEKKINETIDALKKRSKS